MRLLRLAAPVVCAFALLAAAPEAPWRERLAAAVRSTPFRPFCRILLEPVNKFTRVMPPERPAGNAVTAAVNTATITVQYTGFTPQAQAAFQAAIDIWQQQVASSVPIVVTAEFKNLGSGSLLGQAGPTTSFANFNAGAPSNTWFPIPIVNRIGLSDFNGATEELHAEFNSARADWYFGTDGNTPVNQIDFVSVVLHELGHGLGFLGAGTVSGGLGAVRATGGAVRYPFIYDTFTVDGLGRNLTNTAVFPDNSAALAAALTGSSGGVFWNGPATNSATPQRPRLYSPATWQQGSSYSHLDETTFPAGNGNSLMTPSIGFHEAIHVPGPIMLAMFQDMGWGSAAPSCSYVLSSSSAGVTSPAGSGTVTVTANTGCAWTAVSNASFVTVTGGSSGSGNGTVSYSYTANTNTSQRIATMTIAGQTFTLSQAGAPIPGCSYTLSSTSASAASAGGAATVGVTSGLGCVWSATSNSSFITITSGASGSGNGTVGYTVAANTNASQRTGTMTVASQTVTVTQAGTGTTPSGPSVALDRTSLQFAATHAGSSFAQQTLPQTVRLSQTGSGTFAWTATPSQPWITVSPSSGNGPATLTIGVQFAGGLPVSGSSTGSVALSLTGASNTAGPVTVGLTTVPNGTGAVPVGLIETPPNGATGLTGSIAVTGWAIDDIEVRTVRILRDPVPGEGPALIFIGNAVLVDGSRPDVAAANPTRPRNTRAGWGYLLLTNFLPGGGNGTYRLHAIADDADGHSTEIGTRTITCSNSTAILPFGAIDTPGQGEVISGSSFNNFGWVMSRGPALAYPPNGTVNVVIDGVVVGSPTGWTSRPDLTALFAAATYPGVTNAAGVFTFNTTTLTNGVHTIAWVVTDNAGRADGVGSRFFTVANGTGLTLASPLESVSLEGPALMPAVRPAGARMNVTLPLRDEVNAAPQDRSPILGRRGFSLATPFSTYEVGTRDRTVVLGEELDRFELKLREQPGVVVAGATERYTGYLRVGGELAPLPIGSFLDVAEGIFYWTPGVSFIGPYDLVFVRWSQGQAVARQELRIVLNVAGRNRVGPQVVIDTPRPACSVRLQPDCSQPDPIDQPFIVAGWAIDPDAGFETGIDTLHVWAYPLTCDDAGCQGAANPIFLGPMAYGGERPDVAALFGDRFLGSGFSLTVESLPAGTYDVAVFPWSTAVGDFAPAKVVRVTVR